MDDTSIINHTTTDERSAKAPATEAVAGRSDTPDRIRKVKRTKDGIVRIEFERMNAGGMWDEYTIACHDEPRPEFDNVMKALRLHVLDICELPEMYKEGLKVVGVSFSYSGDDAVMGATITALKSLATSNAPLVINTPHKPSEPLSETDTNYLTKKCVEDLQRLIDEARAYIDGDRAQMDLFTENRKAA